MAGHGYPGLEKRSGGQYWGNPTFKNGTYDPATDFVLGKFGVDRQANVVWAVVNHNSQFAVMQSNQLPPPTDYPSWTTQNFTEAERADDAISGANADADGDGLTNQEEYAFFIDPRSFSQNPVAASYHKRGSLDLSHCDLHKTQRGN